MTVASKPPLRRATASECLWRSSKESSLFPLSESVTTQAVSRWLLLKSLKMQKGEPLKPPCCRPNYCLDHNGFPGEIAEKAFYRPSFLLSTSEVYLGLFQVKDCNKTNLFTFLTHFLFSLLNLSITHFWRARGIRGDIRRDGSLFSTYCTLQGDDNMQDNN